MLRPRALGAAAALLLVPPAVVALALAAAIPAVAGDDSPRGEVRVRWFGQACFELTFPTGLVVLTDPFGEIGTYKFPRDVKPDVVTISHEHMDHNNVKDVAGSPTILRGLTSADKDKQDWNKHDLTIKGVRIRSVGTYHDPREGAERGKNALFVFEPEKKDGSFSTIVHLGDLGHEITDAQRAAVGDANTVLAPVGGHFTIDAAGAQKVCGQLLGGEGWIVPMHYKTPALKPEIPLAPVEPFVELYKEHARRIDGNVWAAPVPIPPGIRKKSYPTTVVVLGYEPGPRAAAGDATTKEGDQVAKAAPTVKISEARAWTNNQGPKGPAVFFSFTVDAQAGAEGASLLLSGELSLAGPDPRAVKLAGKDFDDDAGKPQPAAGWVLKAGEKKTLKVVASENGAAVPGENPMARFVATLTPTGGKAVTDTASPAIQNVR